MSNIVGGKAASIVLGGKDVELDYPMGSIHYLVGKYGDITKLFERDEKAISIEYLEKIADVVYAGLMKFDDDGKDTSGWSVRKVLNLIHFNQIPEVVESFRQSMNLSMPEGPAEGEADPTKAAETETQG